MGVFLMIERGPGYSHILFQLDKEVSGLRRSYQAKEEMCNRQVLER